MLHAPQCVPGFSIPPRVSGILLWVFLCIQIVIYRNHGCQCRDNYPWSKFKRRKYCVQMSDGSQIQGQKGHVLIVSQIPKDSRERRMKKATLSYGKRGKTIQTVPNLVSSKQEAIQYRDLLRRLYVVVNMLKT